MTADPAAVDILRSIRPGDLSAAFPTAVADEGRDNNNPVHHPHDKLCLSFMQTLFTERAVLRNHSLFPLVPECSIIWHAGNSLGLGDEAVPSCGDGYRRLAKSLGSLLCQFQDAPKSTNLSVPYEGERRFLPSLRLSVLKDRHGFRIACL